MVSEQTRRLVRKRSEYLCEYCHSPEYLSPDRFTIDHIMPQSRRFLPCENSYVTVEYIRE
ncbi:MAG: HNH endonuclease [Nostoc sp.]|uniref:HNH endonuclease n=1 Tax=Nostoc sp. TaxID=1180 RepID=UPI002FF6B5FD